MFSCRYDTVQFTNSLGQKIIGQLSGSIASFYIIVEGSTTHLLHIKFTSDSSETKRGFLAQYNISTTQPPSNGKLISFLLAANCSLFSIPWYSQVSVSNNGC